MATTRTYLASQGLLELFTRAVMADDSGGVVAAVRSGRADVGLVYGSDAERSGCRLLFRARRGVPAIRFEGAVINRGRQPDEAAPLLQFLGSPAAARPFRACGFRPISRR